MIPAVVGLATTFCRERAVIDSSTEAPADVRRAGLVLSEFRTLLGFMQQRLDALEIRLRDENDRYLKGGLP